MAVEQCIAQLREIEAQIDKARTTNLIFAAKEKGDPPSFSIKHAQIHQRLVADFKAISKRAAKSLCESNLISYDTGYKLDSGDVMYFDLKSRQPIKELIDNVKDIDSLGLIKKDDNYFKNISFYGIYHSLGNQDILCLSGISPQNILKKSKKIGLFVQDGLYDRVEEDSLIINREIHCIAFKEYLFILNLTGFYRLSQYHDEVLKSAHDVIDSAVSKIPILNLEEFTNIGTSDYRMASKLASIKNKSYIATLTLDRVKQVIKTFNIQIEVKKDTDGNEKLVFDASQQKRFLILKVLDDDYLSSDMTSNKYAVNSKIQS